MQKLIMVTAFSILSLITSVHAQEPFEKVLCVVASDVDKDIGKMVYEMDEETRTIKHLYKERYVNNKLVEREEVDTGDLQGEGIILHQKDKIVTVRLYSDNFDETRGGILHLDTLYNAISGQRKEYIIDVSMNGDTATMYYNKQPFSRMTFMAKRSPILGIIGIEKVNFGK